MVSGVDRYYETLGVWPGASFEELRRAYRGLVRVWHPDRFSHDPELQRRAQERLKAINESYSRLKAERPSAGSRAGAKNPRTRERAPTTREASPPRSGASARAGKKTVLVVEGDPEARRELRDFFLKRGYQVREARWGDEAVSAYIRERPQMVLIGTGPSDSAGPETLSRLKTVDPEGAFILASPEAPGQSSPEGVLRINKPINYGYLGLALKARLGQNGGIVDVRV